MSEVTHIKPDEGAVAPKDDGPAPVPAPTPEVRKPAMQAPRISVEELAYSFEALAMEVSNDMRLLQTRVRFLEDAICELKGIERKEFLAWEGECHTKTAIRAYRVRSGQKIIETNTRITGFNNVPVLSPELGDDARHGGEGA